MIFVAVIVAVGFVAQKTIISSIYEKHTRKNQKNNPARRGETKVSKDSTTW